MAAKKTAQVDARGGWMKTVVAIIGTATPIVIKIVNDNPDLIDRVKPLIVKLKPQDKATPEAMLKTVEVLREEVEKLAASADDEQEAAQVAKWSAKLDAASRAANVLAAPGSTAKQRKSLKKQIDVLRGEIVAAYVRELDEDAKAAKK